MLARTGIALTVRAESARSTVGLQVSLGQGHELLCLSSHTCEMVAARLSLGVVMRIQ